MTVALQSRTGRGVILATVLGSGMAFLDGTVVNVALPRMGRELGGGLATQQWVLDGYMLTLSALLLLGGALGDHYGRRRIFVIGLVAFTLASIGCGVAPDGSSLVVARLVQGIGGAMLVPGSLSLINSTIRSEDRGRAIGMWAGMSGVATALGPFLGGWLVDAVSWRLVFLINVPLAIPAVWATLKYVPESRTVMAPRADGRAARPDILGALAVTVGLAGLTYALIEVPARGWSVWSMIAAPLGVIGLVAFPFIETRVRQPLLPLELFRSLQFTGANITTLVVYGALGGALFLLALQLQQSMGYSALEAGLATLPITIVMMLFSSRVGGLAQRTGPRIPMTIGPLIAGAGLCVMAWVTPGRSYWSVTFPAVLIFAIGLTTTVAPLTSAVLAAADEAHVGAASGVNNAVSRLAGLLAVAILPAVAGIRGGTGALGPGFSTAMVVSGIVCGLGGVVAFLTVRRSVAVQSQPLPGVDHACQEPCTRTDADADGLEPAEGLDAR